MSRARRAGAHLLALAALLAPGCQRRALAPVAARYVVGDTYRAGGVWRYPAEDFSLDATGLAAVLPDRRGLTADDEASDPAAMAAAHPTLQLPAIARVTNLENGLQVMVRVNDRGPDNPGRLIGLTRVAANRLGIPVGGVARVRVQVESEASQALRDQLGGGPSPAVRAPRVAVTSESLPPPPGVGEGRRTLPAPGFMPASAPETAAPVPDRLPDAATRVAATPGQLWIRAGEFGQRRLAEQVRARLGGPAAVQMVRSGRGEAYRVRSGPFGSVAAADSALDAALRAGVTDAHIVVE